MLKTTPHPLRKISYKIDENKAWTKRDEKLQRLLIQWHDEEWSRKKEVEALHGRFKKIIPEREELNKQFNTLKKQTDAKLLTADRLMENPGKLTDKQFNKFQNNLLTLNDRILEFDGSLKPFSKQMEKLIKDYNHLIEMEDEQEHSPLQQLRDLVITYFHDSRMATDYASFDDEMESATNLFNYHYNANVQLLNTCNNFISEHNLLITEISGFYRLWNEFGKRITLLEKLLGSEDSFPGFCVN